MSDDEDYAADIHARDAAQERARQMLAILDAIALIAARISKLEGKIDEILWLERQVAQGLGIDISAARQ